MGDYWLRFAVVTVTLSSKLLTAADNSEISDPLTLLSVHIQVRLNLHCMHLVRNYTKNFILANTSPFIEFICLENAQRFSFDCEVSGPHLHSPLNLVSR